MTGFVNRLSCLAVLGVLLFCGINPCHGNEYSDICVERSSLCTELKEKGFSDEQIYSVFSDPRIVLYPEILEKRGKGLNYMSRKFGLLTRKSIERGRKMLRENRKILTDVSTRYLVEPEVLVAIYRVETNFGTYLGPSPVFNNLLTLTLLENRRSDWAEEELINLMVLARLNSIDPLSIKGSWAGAFGLCQFVPTSYLKYGADGNGDGVIDLFLFADAMASIANYLKEHGWDRGKLDKKKQAIYAYNHCDNYVQAVLAYAKATKGGAKKNRSKKS